jgi:hypothetical protein
MKAGLSNIISAFIRQPKKIFSTHHCEQYVSTQMIAGKDVSTQGEAKTYGLRVAQVAVQLLLS